ncbi:MAG: hypothetical protein ABIG84_02585 [archaeon]
MKGYSKRDNKDGEYYINHTSNKDGCKFYQGNDDSARGVCRNMEKTPTVVDCLGTEDKCESIIGTKTGAKVVDEKTPDVRMAESKRSEPKLVETKVADAKIAETKKK